MCTCADQSEIVEALPDSAIGTRTLVPQSAMTMIRYLIIFGHFGWCMAGARFEMLDSGRFVGLH